MAKFETDIEWLTQFSVAGKKIKANKDGQFELTTSQEAAIRAAGYVLTLVPEAPKEEKPRTAAPSAKGKNEGKDAQPPAATAPEPAATPEASAPAGDQNPPAAEPQPES